VREPTKTEGAGRIKSAGGNSPNAGVFPVVGLIVGSIVLLMVLLRGCKK
jgi:hypothetical protein